MQRNNFSKRTNETIPNEHIVGFMDIFLGVPILSADFTFFCATKYDACACYFDSRKSCFTLNYAQHRMVTNSGRVLRVHFLVLNNRIEVVIPVSLHFV